MYFGIIVTNLDAPKIKFVPTYTKFIMVEFFTCYVLILNL